MYVYIQILDLSLISDSSLGLNSHSNDVEVQVDVLDRPEVLDVLERHFELSKRLRKGRRCLSGLESSYDGIVALKPLSSEREEIWKDFKEEQQEKIFKEVIEKILHTEISEEVEFIPIKDILLIIIYIYISIINNKHIANWHGGDPKVETWGSSFGGVGTQPRRSGSHGPSGSLKSLRE